MPFCDKFITSIRLRLCSLVVFFVVFIRDFNQVLGAAPGLLFACFAAQADGIEKGAVVNLGLQLGCRSNVLDKEPFVVRLKSPLILRKSAGARS